MELVKLPAAGTPFWDYSQQLEAEHGWTAVDRRNALQTAEVLDLESKKPKWKYIQAALPLLLRLYRSWDWMLKHEFHSRRKVSA